MVQIQQNNPLPGPNYTISDQYCSQYHYSDILIFILGAFRNQYDTLVYCTALGFPDSDGFLIFAVNCSMPLLHALQQILASVFFLIGDIVCYAVRQ